MLPPRQCTQFREAIPFAPAVVAAVSASERLMTSDWMTVDSPRSWRDVDGLDGPADIVVEGVEDAGAPLVIGAGV